MGRSKGGAKPDERVVDATVICKRVSDGQVMTRCLASAKCNKVYKGSVRKRGRWLKHLTECPHLPKELHHRVEKEFGQAAPAARAVASRKRLAGDLDDEDWSDADEDDDEDGESERKQKEKEKMRRARKKAKKGEGSLVLNLSRKAGREDLKNILDNDVVQFICENGVPPAIVKSRSWKQMWTDANPRYTPVSATTLQEVHIPQQAQFVRTAHLEYLRTQRNITISFDGGTTRRPQSVYTFHAITTDRRVFLIRGDEASGFSHTSKHISDVTCEVCPWSIISADHTLIEPV